jgi:protoheme ferro-lyase
MTLEEKIILLFDIAQLAGVYLDAEIEEPESDYTRTTRQKLKEHYEEFCQWRYDKPFVVDEVKGLHEA